MARDRLRVLLVGDDPLARAGLAALLASELDITVVAQTTSHDPPPTAARRAEVALWDLGSPASDGAAIDFHATQLPVLVLVADAGRTPEALAAGARGVLHRSAEPSRIAAALGAVRLGLVVLEDESAAAILPAATAPVEMLPEPLTPRESEVLQLLARGLSNKEIARLLGISEHTAKFHVNAILAKLGAQGRTEAVVRAARLGLVVL